MRFDIITIFPGFFAGPLDYGIVRRARESGLVEVGVHDLRDFTHDRHRSVDDRPFGGGEGMVLKPEPLFEAVESLIGRLPANAAVGAGKDAGATKGMAPASTAIILLSASGKLFRQSEAVRLAALDRIVLLCGRYEGVDERVAEHLATDEISIGDFVLSGGELAAALVVDAVTRLLPGALGNEASTIEESFSARGELGEIAAPAQAVSAPSKSEQYLRELPFVTQGKQVQPAPVLLDYPHYTRPADFRGWPVPEILIGGNHEEVRRWRRRMALEKTRRNRPDLLTDTR